jgi:hypothetical protein
MPREAVVLLTVDDPGGRAAAQFLGTRFPDFSVIVETPVSRVELLRRRLRRLGVWRVAGQLAFMVLMRGLAVARRGRIERVRKELGLDPRWPDGATLIRVPSVNAPECLAALKRIAPAVVLVCGTRLIEGRVLRDIGVPFINYHAGITPKYRGVHGGYWALAEGDAENCGVTVHLIDEGIDTGGILHQARISVGSSDSYLTYPERQLAAALPLLEQAAREAMAGTLRVKSSKLPSRLWSHPTIWSYLATGLRRGVW